MLGTVRVTAVLTDQNVGLSPPFFTLGTVRV